MPKWSRYQGVTAFVGMPGGGKSYGLAEMAAVALRRGLPVYSNAGFDVQGSTILSSFDDFCQVQGPALIVWDELPLYFNSRKWAEFPDGLLYKFTQIRKDGLRLAYSTIHEDMVDVNIRRVTFWYWHCRAVTPRLLRRTLWPPSEFRKASAKPYAREWVWVRPAIARLYDTWGKVSVQKTVAARIDSVDGSGFVRPGLAGPEAKGGRRAAPQPAKPVGAGRLPPARPEPGASDGADPWGLPLGDGLSLPPDEAPIGWDRLAWPRV